MCGIGRTAIYICPDIFCSKSDGVDVTKGTQQLKNK